MAYTAFTDGKPVGTDTGLQAVDYIRQNLMAMRDAVVMGAMSGWGYSSSGGAQPATVTYSRGTERLRAILGWSGAGHVVTAVWQYSPDSGASWQGIGSESVSWSAEDDLLSVTGALLQDSAFSLGNWSDAIVWRDDTLWSDG